MEKTTKKGTDKKTTIVPQTETTIINDQKNENMNDQKNDQNNDQKTDVIERNPDTITIEIKDAKKHLNELNDKYDYDETNVEIVAQEKKISDLHDERKSLLKTIEKTKLENEFNEKLRLAKDDLIEKFGISAETLQSLIDGAKITEDVREKQTIDGVEQEIVTRKKDTLVASFNTIFGKQPIFVAEGTKGIHLKSSSTNSNGSINLSKMIKEMLVAGNTSDEIVFAIEQNSDLRDEKSKKRLTDTRWQWEKETGRRS